MLNRTQLYVPKETKVLNPGDAFGQDCLVHADFNYSGKYTTKCPTTLV